MCVCVYIYMYVLMCVCMYVLINICVCVCVCVCVRSTYVRRLFMAYIFSITMCGVDMHVRLFHYVNCWCTADSKLLTIPCKLM